MKFNTFHVLTVFCTVLYIQGANCIIPLVPLGYAGAGLAGMYTGYTYLKCKVTECCNGEYIPADIWRKYFMET